MIINIEFIRNLINYFDNIAPSLITKHNNLNHFTQLSLMQFIIETFYELRARSTGKR